MMDDHERYLSDTSLFTDFSIGMLNWTANDFETAQTCFKKVILQLDVENSFIKYIENTLYLVGADSRFMGLFSIEDPSLFYESLMAINYVEVGNAIKAVYNVENPISHSIPEVTDVIAGRGFCVAGYAYFLRTVFDLLRQLENATIDKKLIRKIKGSFSKIKDKNEVVKIGETFVYACIDALITHKTLKSIPKHRYSRLMNLLNPLWHIYKKWMNNLLLKKTRVSFCEKNILQLNNQIDPLVFLVYEEGLSPKFQNKKPEYARMWTNETPPEGKIIDKEEFDRYEKNKADYQIFIIDRGEIERSSVGEICFGKKAKIIKDKDAKTKERIKAKKKTDITSTDYKILFHTLKNGGRTGDIFTILEQCFGKDIKEHGPGEKSWVELYKTEPTIFWDATRTHRKAIGELSTFLCKKIGVILQSKRKRIFKLIPIPPYCLLQIK